MGRYGVTPTVILNKEATLIRISYFSTYFPLMGYFMQSK